MQMRLKVYLIFDYLSLVFDILIMPEHQPFFQQKNLFTKFFSKFFSNDNMQMILKAYWTFDDLSLVPEHRPFIHSFILLFIHQFIYSFLLKMRLLNKMRLEPQTKYSKLFLFNFSFCPSSNWKFRRGH